MEKEGVEKEGELCLHVEVCASLGFQSGGEVLLPTDQMEILHFFSVFSTTLISRQFVRLKERRLQQCFGVV